MPRIPKNKARPKNSYRLFIKHRVDGAQIGWHREIKIYHPTGTPPVARCEIVESTAGEERHDTLLLPLDRFQRITDELEGISVPLAAADPSWCDTLCHQLQLRMENIFIDLTWNDPSPPWSQLVEFLERLPRLLQLRDPEITKSPNFTSHSVGASR